VYSATLPEETSSIQEKRKKKKIKASTVETQRNINAQRILVR
jgi:hypothetical protein